MTGAFDSLHRSPFTPLFFSRDCRLGTGGSKLNGARREESLQLPLRDGLCFAGRASESTSPVKIIERQEQVLTVGWSVLQTLEPSHNIRWFFDTQAHTEITNRGSPEQVHSDS